MMMMMIMMIMMIDDDDDDYDDDDDDDDENILHKNYGDTACKEFNIESTSISKHTQELQSNK